MYYLLTLNVFLFFICTTKCRNMNNENGRLFGTAYTSTIKKSKIITDFVPSSCVQVDATLPPCRNVRYLKFPSLAVDPSLNGLGLTKTESSIYTTPLGWGEYLGFYPPTITVTETEIYTTTVQDHGIVVTFAVKGCRPLKLPLELDICQTNSILIEEILPTSTVTAKIEPTATLLDISTVLHENIDNFKQLNDEHIAEFHNLIEVSTEGLIEGLSSLQSTETLQINNSTN